MPKDANHHDQTAGQSSEAAERLPQRKHPAHGVFPEGDKPVIVLVTVCTNERKPWLVSVDVHELLSSVWADASAWLVGRYVVMPDHVHQFASPGAIDLSLDNWVRYWKSQFTKRFARPECRWQTDHWDTRLRSRESYEARWEYVRGNPVRHGLAERAEEWPFQGEVHVLPWC
ncbi:MAG: hypothetical protein GW911_27310 [Armatimonadetes bacterium]|nr:hypothetical protein [Armatimonadota bacterium]